MTKLNDQQAVELLKKHIRPMQDAELRHDLWPVMLRRLDQRSVVLSLFDLVLLAVLLVVMIFWPHSITGLFYQL